MLAVTSRLLPKKELPWIPMTGPGASIEDADASSEVRSAGKDRSLVSGSGDTISRDILR